MRWTRYQRHLVSKHVECGHFEKNWNWTTRKKWTWNDFMQKQLAFSIKSMVEDTFCHRSDKCEWKWIHTTAHNQNKPKDLSNAFWLMLLNFSEIFVHFLHCSEKRMQPSFEKWKWLNGTEIGTVACGQWEIQNYLYLSFVCFG